MVKTIFTYAVAIIQALGPAGLLGVMLLACGFWELSGIHLTPIH